MNRSIAIVTDSTADLPEEFIQRYDITVVPNVIIINGEVYEDGIDITRDEYYRKLPLMTESPKTSTASIGKFEKVYAKLINEGADHIISIHASKLLSGIYNSAKAASQMFNSKITVIDSKQLSMGLGFQVIHIAQQLLQNQSLDQMVSLIASFQERITVTAMLDTLEYVKRSGRISWAGATFLNLLKVKPFLVTRNGLIERLGETRTFKRGINKLKNLIEKDSHYEWLAVLHTNIEDTARNFAKRLDVQVENNIQIINVTTVIGTHAGPGCLGFACVRVNN